MRKEFPELRAGDHLLYKPSDFFGFVTAVKTWSPDAVHIEVYVGGGRSLASRNGLGVSRYPLRLLGLSEVLRPIKPMNLDAGNEWFASKADGQKYDWIGLLCFTLAVKQGAPNKMFCSEFATRFDRACGFDCVHPEYDADRVAPGTFLVLPDFEHVWSAA